MPNYSYVQGSGWSDANGNPTGGPPWAKGSTYDPAAFPGAPPDYLSGFDPKTQSLWGQLGGQMDRINPDMRGINAYRQEALRTGPSAWATLAGQQQDMMASGARSNAAATSAGKADQAMSDLAMRGGVDSGARERISRDSSKNLLDMNQQIGHDSAANKMQIGMNDEQNRISQLGALPGMENQALQPAMEKLRLQGQAMQFDTQNSINDAARKNDYNLGRYHEQMGGWAAGKQADATASSKK